MESKHSIAIGLLLTAFCIISLIVFSKLDNIVTEMSEISSALTNNRINFEKSLNSYDSIAGSVAVAVNTTDGKKIKEKAEKQIQQSIATNEKSFRSWYERYFLNPAKGSGWIILRPSNKWVYANAEQNHLVWPGSSSNLVAVLGIDFSPSSYALNKWALSSSLASSKTDAVSDYSASSGKIMKIDGNPGEPGILGSLALNGGIIILLGLTGIFTLLKMRKTSRK